MPTYQYACTVCGHQLEAVQAFSDAALTVCPECDGALRKVFSAVGIVFKGSGFYRTDSRSGSGSKAGESASTNGATSESTPSAGSGSTESKSQWKRVRRAAPRSARGAAPRPRRP